MEAGFVITEDKEILLCLKTEARDWSTLGAVIVGKNLFYLIAEEKILYKSPYVHTEILNRMITQKTINTISTTGKKIPSINQCTVVDWRHKDVPHVVESNLSYAA